MSYWSERASSFLELRLKEYKSDKNELWIKEIEKYLPVGKQLEILDLGTGTGYFAFLLSSIGHHVTGIDLTEAMIEGAKSMSEQIGISAKFYVMDAENPDFSEQSFDVLITRNLTWTLPNLDKAYKAWHKLLKPDGILINFDADYAHESSHQVLPKHHSHEKVTPKLREQYENIKKDLRLIQKTRPQWDRELLEQAGFHDIQIDFDVYQRIYSQKDEFYNPTPIFTIVAHS